MLSSDEELDIYADLPNTTTSDHIKKLEEQVEHLEEKVKHLEEKLKIVEDEKNKILEEYTKIVEQKNKLSKNITSFYYTAVNEVERKDKRIAELQKELDDLKFKRNHQGNKNSHQWEETSLNNRIKDGTPLAPKNVNTAKLEYIHINDQNGPHTIPLQNVDNSKNGNDMNSSTKKSSEIEDQLSNKDNIKLKDLNKNRFDTTEHVNKNKLLNQQIINTNFNERNNEMNESKIARDDTKRRTHSKNYYQFNTQSENVDIDNSYKTNTCTRNIESDQNTINPSIHKESTNFVNVPLENNQGTRNKIDPRESNATNFVNVPSEKNRVNKNRSMSTELNTTNSVKEHSENNLVGRNKNHSMSTDSFNMRSEKNQVGRNGNRSMSTELNTTNSVESSEKNKIDQNRNRSMSTEWNTTNSVKESSEKNKINQNINRSMSTRLNTTNSVKEPSEKNKIDQNRNRSMSTELTTTNPDKESSEKNKIDHNRNRTMSRKSNTTNSVNVRSEKSQVDQRRNHSTPMESNATNFVNVSSEKNQVNQNINHSMSTELDATNIVNVLSEKNQVDRNRNRSISGESKTINSVNVPLKNQHLLDVDVDLNITSQNHSNVMDINKSSVKMDPHPNKLDIQKKNDIANHIPDNFGHKKYLHTPFKKVNGELVFNTPLPVPKLISPFKPTPDVLKSKYENNQQQTVINKSAYSSQKLPHNKIIESPKVRDNKASPTNDQHIKKTFDKLFGTPDSKNEIKPRNTKKCDDESVSKSVILQNNIETEHMTINRKRIISMPEISEKRIRYSIKITTKN